MTNLGLAADPLAPEPVAEGTPTVDPTMEAGGQPPPMDGGMGVPGDAIGGMDAMPPVDGPNELYPPPPPSEQELLGALGESERQRTVELAARTVDPSISPRDRLLTGAQVHANSAGADIEGYETWDYGRMTDSIAVETPDRPGMSDRQGRILTAADSMEMAAELAPTGSEARQARISAWVDMYRSGGQPGAAVDIARVDRWHRDGVLTGRAKELWGALLAGRLADDEADELSGLVTEVARATDNFADDGTLGNGQLIRADGTAVRVRYTDIDPDEPVGAPGALEALPGEALPFDALEGKGPTSGFDLHVIDGDATLIGRPSDEVTAAYRRGFPAVKGGDGTPRWLAVHPAHVGNVRDINQLAARQPATVVDTHLQLHPGLLPYDSIVFEVDERSRHLEELGAQRLGAGASARPLLAATSIAPDDLVDSTVVGEHLSETMWAVFSTGNRVKLHPRHTPIPLDDEWEIVFGIAPGEAAEATTGFAFVNDGIATRLDDAEQIADSFVEAPEWVLRAADGSETSFSASLDESPLVVDRRVSSADRWHLPVTDLSKPHLAGLADHLELAGGVNLAAYVSMPALSGFERATEHLWNDGGSAVVSSRTAGALEGSNALPVWVRSTEGLPSRPLEVPADHRDTMPEEAGAELLRGGRWRIDARGAGDISAQVRQAHALADKYGYDKVEVVGDDGPIALVEGGRR